MKKSSWESSLKEGASYLASQDPKLAKIIKQYPLPHISPHSNYYQELVESIISQQLSVKAAASILAKFKSLFNDNFPLPGEILNKDIESLRSVGLSRQKASYIQDLATKMLDNTIDFERLDRLSDNEVIDELTKIKGVGVWTVHMFLIFCMGRLDVLPVGDLGIKNGIMKLYDLPERPSDDTMKAIAKENGWQPYQSIASCYIWRSLDNKPVIT